MPIWPFLTKFYVFAVVIINVISVAEQGLKKLADDLNLGCKKKKKKGSLLTPYRGDSGTLLINSEKMSMTVPLIHLRNGCRGQRVVKGGLFELTSGLSA